MSKETTPVNESDLHAYADGKLDAARAAEVEQWLDRNPEQAAMVEDWKRQNTAIRALFADYERTDPADIALIAGAKERSSFGRPAPRRFVMQTAAAFLLFVAGAAVGPWVPPIYPVAPQAVLQEIALPDQSRSAFLIYASDVRHPVEVGASEKTHLAAWLGKRLDYPLAVPDLGSIGFRLVGGRLVPVNGKPGALFMYEDDSGQRVTVLIGRNGENRSTSFRYASQDGLETFYWIDGPIGYAVTGEISRDRLQQVADECYRQFPT
ncbi:anti-sigma factor [Agrobacterium sp. a22-2]|uniref:anti-sigma factor family protein n=1 Tax=Agrobacterium sp. a22-2 TaxID=2283840 RepID=UPI001445CE30|nr:anti-sigma factor [Agrobacterium sp. a22-2]NKN36281.1 anti-sigma factor [Agrobacterium sp. a22-2]